MKQSRASRARSALLAAPAVLLAVGWGLAAQRDSAAAQARRRQVLAASAHAVVAAVGEGLEELRAREDERPYYHYAYYFTPPEVIAVQESVAVSPLGSVPRDPRVRGHFQIDPGPAIQLPLEHSEASARAHERARELRAALEGPLARRLAAFATPEDASRRVATADTINPWANPAGNTIQQQNAYSNEVLNDIRSAQSGERAASTRSALRGRAPARPRVNLNYRAFDNNFYGRVQSSTPGAGDGITSRAGELTDGDFAAATSADLATSEPASAVRDVGDAALYTPMAFQRADDGSVYLMRTVTTQGATSVQGVLLDAQVLRARWVDSVLRRHGVPGVSLAVTDASACAAGVFNPLPSPLDAQGVCATDRAQGRRGFRVEWLAIAGTLALVFAAGVAHSRALRRAEDLAETERAFVASVSHELRTPLTTLRMHAEMLSEGWVSEERKPRVMRQLVDESTRLARLIEDVLTFGRLADGRAQLVLVEGDLRARVGSLVERESPRLLERGLAVRVDSPGEPPLVARFDETALEQVLLNLLENAARYGRSAAEGGEREGEPSQRAPSPCEVTVLARGPGQVVVRVRDHGRGIAERDRERVFERFYRTPDALKSHVAGTGLGLAIVRGLARAMGGEARVVDTHDGGPGCAIEVALPAVVTASPTRDARPEPAPAQGAPRG